MTETMVRERPILFSAPMVRAILDGRKTQTRRVIPAPVTCGDNLHGWIDRWKGMNAPLRCPYGEPGDCLWVRETFWDHGDLRGRRVSVEERVEYRATPWDRKGADDADANWRPSIYMPRWASRLTLEVTEVRVERVQEISEGDAIAEGMPNWFGWDRATRMQNDPREAFRALWDSLNAKRGHGWEHNPWVWAISFLRFPSMGTQ